MDSSSPRILASVCARGGSQGVKNKNIRSFLGRPLLQWTLLQAKSAKIFSAIVVSSDSPEILNAAKDVGVDLLIPRPGDLATHTAGKIPAIQHAHDVATKELRQDFDLIMDLDCTSPLRNVDDIQKCIEYFLKKNADIVITGSPARRSPYFNLVEEKKDGSISLAKIGDAPILRRQDAPRCFDMNASMYVWNPLSLKNSKTLFGPKTFLFEMPEERSWDIDSEMDFAIVEFLASQRPDFKV